MACSGGSARPLTRDHRCSIAHTIASIDGQHAPRPPTLRAGRYLPHDSTSERSCTSGNEQKSPLGSKVRNLSSICSSMPYSRGRGPSDARIRPARLLAWAQKLVLGSMMKTFSHEDYVAENTTPRQTPHATPSGGYGTDLHIIRSAAPSGWGVQSALDQSYHEYGPPK